MKKTVKTAIRVLVSGLLIAVIVYLVDIEKTFRILAEIKPQYLILPVMLLFVQTAISTYKWKLILAVEEVRIGFGFLFKTYLIGQFISLFLPSSIGGDVYRVASIKSKVQSFSLRFSSVFFDRASGLYGLLLVGACGSAVLLDHGFTLILLACILSIPLLFVVFTTPRITERLRASRLWLLRTCGDVLVSQRKFAVSKSIVPIMAIALMFHGGVVAINYLYCQALSLDIRFVELWAVVPLVYITDMIPLSINGIGIRDTAYVFFFSLLGYPAEHAFALSLVVIALRYLFGTVGGMLLLGDILTKSGGIDLGSLRKR